jgi:putative transposase
MVPQAVGRNVQQSTTTIDSQSIKTTCVGGPERGFDGGKKVNSCKRHLLVATQSLVLALKVHGANISDHDGTSLVLNDIPKRFPRIRKLSTDSGEAATF